MKNNMDKLRKSYLKLDDFLVWQLWVSLVTRMTWSLCIPIIHKLQGLHWSTAYISLYIACDRMSGLLVPLFRGGSFKSIYALNMILNAIYAFSLVLYFYDTQAFLLVEVALGMVFGVLGPLYKINYDVHIVSNYPKDTYEDFLYLDGVRAALGGVLGGLLVAGVSSVFEMDKTIMVFMGAMMVMIFLQQKNWRLHYSHLS